MIRRVLKFGGEALADGPAVRRAVGIVAAAGRGAAPPVVVVSACAGVTDRLQEAARAAAAGRPDTGPIRLRHRSLLSQLELASEPFDRFWRELTVLLDQVRQRGAVDPAALDLVLSFGERLSARMVAGALEARGVQATPVDAWDLGLVTDSRHGRAQPVPGVGEAVRRALAEVSGVAVVTGFLAKDRSGRPTTLGRNGSDLTAALLAEALGAHELQFWKTVGGILTADPRLVPDARLLPEVTYAEAAELAFHGARVLHPASVAPVLRAGTAVRVASVLDPEAPGTRFALELPRRGPVSVASRAEVLAIELRLAAPERRGAEAARLCAALEVAGVAPLALGVEGEHLRAVVEPGSGVQAALAALGPRARVGRGLGMVALVGHGVGGRAEVGSRALAALAAEDVAVRQVAGSERAASWAFVIDAADLPRAVRRLHAELVALEPAASMVVSRLEN